MVALRTLSAAFALAAALGSPASAQVVLDDSFPDTRVVDLDELHAAVSADFVDPRSTQYKALLLRNPDFKPAVCGWVNARNSAGGYSPFYRFAYQIESGSAVVAYEYDDPTIGRLLRNTLHVMGCPEGAF